MSRNDTTPQDEPEADEVQDEPLLIFDEAATIWWPVYVKVPVAGGTTRTHEVQMELGYLQGYEVDEINRALMDLDLDKMGTAEDPLVQHVHDWSGIQRQGDDGPREVPCSDTTKRQVLRRTNVRSALLQALFEVATGAPAKNSGTPPAPGPGTGNRQARRAAESTARKANGKSKRS